MNKSDLVSIIIPCFNVENYIQIVFQNLLELDYDNWEAIFVDDGSTDDTWNELSKIYKKDERIAIYSKKNEGVGFARNFGMNNSCGEYVYFMDPDDLLEKNIFSENIFLLKKYKKLDLIIFGYKEIFKVNEKIRTLKNEKNLFFKYKSKITILEIIKEMESELLFNPVWNKIYRRSFLEINKIKFTSQKKGQDAIFNIDVFTACKEIGVNNLSFYNYLSGREGSIQTQFNPKDFDFSEKILLKKLELYKKYGEDEVYIYSNRMVEDLFYDNLKLYKTSSKREYFKLVKNIKNYPKISNKQLLKSNLFKLFILKNKYVSYAFYRLHYR